MHTLANEHLNGDDACSRSVSATTPEKLAPGAFFASAATSAQWLINGRLRAGLTMMMTMMTMTIMIMSVLLNRSELLCLQSVLLFAFPPIQKLLGHARTLYAHYVVIVEKISTLIK